MLFTLYRDGQDVGVTRKTKNAAIGYAMGMAMDWPEYRWSVMDSKGRTVYLSTPDVLTVIAQKFTYRGVTVHLELMDNGWDILAADAAPDLKHVADAVLGDKKILDGNPTNDLDVALRLVCIRIDFEVEELNR